jgi:hypothetical protein
MCHVGEDQWRIGGPGPATTAQAPVLRAGGHSLGPKDRNGPQAQSYIYEVFECLLRLWMGIWLQFTLLPLQTLPQICESWVKSYLMQVCKPYHYALVEAVEPFKLNSMSMVYIHKVFEKLLRMWMGIWLHTHTITTTDASPDLGNLAEILPDASVQTMPLRFD